MSSREDKERRLFSESKTYVVEIGSCSPKLRYECLIDSRFVRGLKIRSPKSCSKDGPIASPSMERPERAVY